LTDEINQDQKRPMGRPSLDMKATNVRFPESLLSRIDALVGQKQRAKFIREAVEARVRYAEELRKMADDEE